MKLRKTVLLSLLILIAKTSPAFADSNSEIQLAVFLQGIGDFLIHVVGPAILVIGVCVGGISMATGNERGLSRGIMAALGGAIIMMARAILDLIQRLTGF
jgi:type IV secretory pathway VirB2 component (pilin)